MAAEWVDVTAPEYWNTDLTDKWDGTKYDHQSWHQQIWGYWDYPEGSPTDVYPTKIRVTVTLVSESSATILRLAVGTADNQDYDTYEYNNTSPAVGTYVIEEDFLPAHSGAFRGFAVGIMYYEAYISKIELFMENPFGPVDNRFWTNHTNQKETCA